MTVIYGKDKDNLEIKINSNEPLGILDTDRIEDYNGIDGQVSLFHVDSSQRFAVIMSPFPAETPGIDHDVFIGQKQLSLIPEGDYQIQGRVRDVVGNYSILSAFHNPNGNETILMMNFSIEGGQIIPRPFGLLKVPKRKPVYKLKARQAVHKIPERKRVYART